MALFSTAPEVMRPTALALNLLVAGFNTWRYARRGLTNWKLVLAFALTAVPAAFIGGGIQVHADYAFHPYVLQTRETFVLATYVGPGVRLIQYSDGRNDSFLAFGLRAVGGLLFDFKNPLDAFIEVAGVFEYGFKDGEGFGAALNAGAGVRYYF